MMNTHSGSKDQSIGFRGILPMAVIFLVLSCSSAKSVAQDQSTRNLFNNNCASCHGQHGIPRAVGKSLNVPTLSSAAVRSQTDVQLRQIISDGKGNMPPFKSSLSE